MWPLLDGTLVRSLESLKEGLKENPPCVPLFGHVPQGCLKDLNNSLVDLGKITL